MLHITDLPDPTDRQAIVLFAASFRGYEHFGSFEACAEDAKRQRRETLIDLRNELFFSYRASNHRGDDGIIFTYRELLPHFRRLLGAQDQIQKTD
ncbi:MAG: hypothetical protein AAF768_03835 [Pseudomonadota bacterium]